LKSLVRNESGGLRALGRLVEIGLVKLVKLDEAGLARAVRALQIVTVPTEVGVSKVGVFGSRR
jgi:hypothetical protein